MGAFAEPGRQQGLKPAPVVARGRSSQRFREWFPNFLRQELKPYPGRGLLVARYTLAASLTMLLIVTFRMPGAAVGGFYSLLLSRESPVTTVRGGLSTLVAFVTGLTFVLLGAILLVDYPLTHFLWVMGSFFIAFYGISAISNYGAATAFAIVIVLSIPLWDQSLPAAAIIVANLWTVGSVGLAIVVTIFVEFVFALFKTGNELTEGLSERLAAVHTVLLQAADGLIEPAARNKLAQFAIVGVSRLRRLAMGENTAEHNTARLSTTVSLVGRVVDILAAFRRFNTLTARDAPRLRALAEQVRRLERKLNDQQGPAVARLEPNLGSNLDPAHEPLIVLGLEQSLELLRLAVSPEPGQSFALDQINPVAPPVLKPDAFSNPEHLSFALRGCLASVLCYVLFNAVFWPALSPSLFTCVVTALTSIGSSRQKQLLRASGAILGGLVVGLGTQILILPMLDTVTGFAVMFVVVTLVAAWFITSSPRLSYFGNQFALAFYLIQLRGPGPQTNLAIARDNVMGILLGLVMMWLVFETFGSKPAVMVMRELFAENLGKMAQLARPWPDGRPADLQKIRTLRDRISQNFAAVHAQADAVLFETGRSRQRSLAVRERLLDWQPQLRSIFLLQVALLQYRLQVSPKDLPPVILRAASRFDDAVCHLLDSMAGCFRRQGKVRPAGEIHEAYSELERSMAEAYRDQPPIRSRAVLAISDQIIELSLQLLEEMERIG